MNSGMFRSGRSVMQRAEGRRTGSATTSRALSEFELVAATQDARVVTHPLGKLVMSSIRSTTFLVTVSALATVGACDDESSAGTSEVAGSGGAAGECSGFAGGGSGPPRLEKRETTQCYVTEATNAGPECLPADDPAALARVRDYISSCGFATEFVIAAAESQPVLAACDELAECCEREGAPPECSSRVNDPREQDRCSLYLDSYRSNGQCSPSASGDAGVSAGASSGGAAGAPASSSRYALCCYTVCGVSRCI